MAKKQKDVVCGMDVDENSKFKSNHNKQNYYFCSESCKKEFDRNPKKYAH
ncbi:MAG: YHS domain-containing protein [Candidatus Marsarchaeota archaeon]|jgi:Cu+-exporting ATPase|nr:YHS domain-containing protein [Candidatus Marsarchaeota archaeon]